MPFMTSALLSLVTASVAVIVIVVAVAVAVISGAAAAVTLARLAGGCNALGCSPVIS